VFTFLSVLVTCTVSVMLSYACSEFSIWLDYLELLLLFLMSRMCSLYLVLNDAPVCPIYFKGQLMHFIWYTPLSSYLCYGVRSQYVFHSVSSFKSDSMCAFLKRFVIFLVGSHIICLLSRAALRRITVMLSRLLMLTATCFSLEGSHPITTQILRNS
jgi:hypothetical protein